MPCRAARSGANPVRARWKAATADRRPRPSIPSAKAWKAAHGDAPSESDIDALYESFVPKNRAIAAKFVDLIPGTAETVKTLDQLVMLAQRHRTHVVPQRLEQLPGRAELLGSLAEREIAVWDGNYYAWELERHLGLVPVVEQPDADAGRPPHARGLEAAGQHVQRARRSLCQPIRGRWRPPTVRVAASRTCRWPRSSG